MRNKPIVVCGPGRQLVCIAFVLSCFDGCTKPDPTTVQLEVLNKQIAQAFENKKPDEILKLWTSDYTEAGPDGKSENRNQAEAIMRAAMDELKTVSISQRLEDVRLTADGATIILQEAFAGTTYHHIGDDDHFTHEVRARQTWLKAPAGWLLKRVDVISTKGN